jgi:hypothetical protein
MLDALLKMITPEELFSAIKSNPLIVQIALQKFEAYKAFGSALTDSQQVCISVNLDKLAPFLASKAGKDSVSILAEEFEQFCK